MTWLGVLNDSRSDDNSKDSENTQSRAESLAGYCGVSECSEMRKRLREHNGYIQVDRYPCASRSQYPVAEKACPGRSCRPITGAVAYIPQLRKSVNFKSKSTTVQRVCVCAHSPEVKSIV